MSSGVNKVILIGNVGRKPERRVTQSGQTVCNFSVCINERFSKDKEKATWLNVVAWGNTGDACAQYLDKGRAVFIEGRIDVRTVEKDGVKRTFTDIIASEVKFLSPSREQKPQTETGAGAFDYDANPFGPLPSFGGPSQEDIPF